MKVKDLIEILKNMPEDNEVEMSVNFNYFKLASVEEDGESVVLINE